MITAKKMRRMSLETTGDVCRAEAHILSAASLGGRRCLLHYVDAQVANSLEEVLVDQGFHVTVGHDGGVSSMLVTW